MPADIPEMVKRVSWAVCYEVVLAEGRESWTTARRSGQSWTEFEGTFGNFGDAIIACRERNARAAIEAMRLVRRRARPRTASEKTCLVVGMLIGFVVGLYYATLVLSL